MSAHHLLAKDRDLRRRHRLSVAPMMDWTDRHCRFFHRLISPHALLYTEMVTTGAVIHGDREKLLGFDPQEHPLALQLGGSDPADLARAARIGADWGYEEVNLNCGCPSERVQKGAFGACLMRESQLVADCLKAMQDAVSLPVTVKHRLGVDDQADYSFVRDFVGALYEAGCRVFVAHARIAILKGLSPKENREIPPLRMALVRRLKADFPEAIIVANGGIQSLEGATALLDPSDEGPAVDGVMLGRAAYHDPWLLNRLDHALFAEEGLQAASVADAGGAELRRPMQREEILEPLEAYFQAGLQRGIPAKTMTRHWHGLLHGQPGARYWRRALCEGESPLAVWRREARMPPSTARQMISESTSAPEAISLSIN